MINFTGMVVVRVLWVREKGQEKGRLGTEREDGGVLNALPTGGQFL